MNRIKVHNCYLGNEKADKLARNSAYNIIVNFSIDPLFTEVKRPLNKKLMEDWDKDWSADNSFRRTNIFYPTVHKGKAKV